MRDGWYEAVLVWPAQANQVKAACSLLLPPGSSLFRGLIFPRVEAVWRHQGASKKITRSDFACQLV